ncbi:FAD/NAD(P)-binding domain-containing protein [Aspergillus steynii IBT 23096]|uniref:FAD/NAD(P)-binding domain-containing protein n=1 Tax=Aspergillus steynii IBT 23096 TaxID=1392250 RepID=A0A2I2GC47_9EURO|nr:FAD/NAD(P)-binding domain-containing protein [Aspergillus steynii IBT 23096]PLB50417.1 FAD/NAD(P)-binding domain-containing protein [Aspergillus steynii IBT 23096]
MFLLSFGLTIALADQFDPHSYDWGDVITKDIAIVGGGSTGTYAAINLLDMGQKVVVVERESVLGGHTSIYTDVQTNTKIDYGVQSFSNISVVRDFFARFHVPLTRFSLNASVIYADFESGELFPKFAPSYDFDAYQTQLKKYPYLPISWDLPVPVPEDLLLSFGEFLNKYSLQDIAYAVWSSARGSGDILRQPAVYILKAVDEPYIEGLSQGTLTTANHNNYELYEKALQELGPDAIVSSTVTAAQRSTDGVRLVVETPSGKKLILASKLLVSIPPDLENMGPFDLDDREKGLFQKFNNCAWYIAVVTNTGFPAGYRFQNIGTSNDTYRIPRLPAIYSINPSVVDGIFYVWYGASQAVAEADVKTDISTAIERLSRGIGKSNERKQKVQFLVYKSHTPFQLVVSAEDIDDGFYRELQGLQGHRSTWYTGAAFLSHHAGQLWNFTQALLPSLAA